MGRARLRGRTGSHLLVRMGRGRLRDTGEEGRRRGVRADTLAVGTGLVGRGRTDSLRLVGVVGMGLSTKLVGQ